MTLNGWLQIAFFLLAILLVTKPLGVFMARVFNRERTFLDPVLRPIERLLYRLTFVDENHEMRWTEYAAAMLLFSVVPMLLLYLIQRVQCFLPFNPQKLVAIPPDLAFNTAASFTTNTNWQNYAGEVVMSYFTQMAGLAYHNFTSAAVGIALAIAFIRGIARRQKDTIGNFWVDMTRATLWVLLPICVVGALLLVSQGVVQNLRPYDKVTLLEPHQVPHLGDDGKPAVDASGKPVMDTVTEQTIAQGPVASQEIIKQFGTNGGGFFNANSCPPVREPDAVLQLHRDVRHLRHQRRAHLHAGSHDRLAASRLGGMGRDGHSFLVRSHGCLLGRSSRQSAAGRRRPACLGHAARRQHGRQGSPLRHCQYRIVGDRYD